jgi:hypothetical protein
MIQTESNICMDDHCKLVIKKELGIVSYKLYLLCGCLDSASAADLLARVRLLPDPVGHEQRGRDGQRDGRWAAGRWHAASRRRLESSTVDASADCNSALRVFAESLIARGTGIDASDRESCEAPSVQCFLSATFLLPLLG